MKARRSKPPIPPPWRRALRRGTAARGGTARNPYRAGGYCWILWQIGAGRFGKVAAR